MNKKIAILQSNYIPWKGYFDLINQVDEFIIYDVVQFTKNDWRNRNKIKTQSGIQWLTIPVKHKFGQKIRETEIPDDRWRQRHWNSIQINYARAKYFSLYKEMFQELYLGCVEKNLSEVNYRFILFINYVLGIKTKITREYEIDSRLDKTERLIELCRRFQANEYISGPAAKDYINEELFTKENIKLEWMNYEGYPEYNQLFPPFEHSVSIIDLIFNEGTDATKYLKSSFRDELSLSK